LEYLEDRIVPSIVDGTILICTGPSSYSSQDQSPFPVGIIGVNPRTGAQFPLSINSSQDGNLFVLPTYVTEGSDGQLYVADVQAFGTGAILRVDPNTGQQFLVAKGGLLNGPDVLTWENGFLYVANEADGSGTVHTIVQVDPNTGAQKLITDGSSGGFTVPTGMAPAPGNTIYVSDEPGGYNGPQPGGVWQVNLSTGQQTLITWGNLIAHPVDLAPDQNGNLLVINVVADTSTQLGKVIGVNPANPDPTNGSNQSLVYQETAPWPLDGVTEDLNSGTIYTGSISYSTVPAELFAISGTPAAQSLVTTGGQLSLVEGMRVYHPMVQTAATATTVTGSVGAPVSGQNETFTATVSPQSSGSGTPTGTVQFQVDGKGVGNAVSITSSGGVATASFSTSTLGIGTHTVTASYSGDSNFASSNGTLSGGQVIAKANTRTAVVSSANPSSTGQIITFTATVTINAPGSAAVASPTGLVVFFDNGTSIGQGTLRTSGGMTVASFSTMSLTAGRHQITAAYTNGDANFNASPVSAAITQTVQRGGRKGGGGTAQGKLLVGSFITSQAQPNNTDRGPQGTAVESDPSPTPSQTQPAQRFPQALPAWAAPSETGTISGPAGTDWITVRTALVDALFADRGGELASD
jgi:hypothetical protein